MTRAVFYGLGSDGTVGASKNSVKIIGENTRPVCPGILCLRLEEGRFDDRVAPAIQPAADQFDVSDRSGHFVACHQFHFLERIDVLAIAGVGRDVSCSTVLIRCERGVGPVAPGRAARKSSKSGCDSSWSMRTDVARRTGMGTRINTAMQTCFFALAGLLPREEAIEHIKEAIRKTYGRRGETVVEQNCAAIDEALKSLHEVRVPPTATSRKSRRCRRSRRTESDFVNRVTAAMVAGRGDFLPVSALPVDGTFPTGTAKFEKRSIAAEIPIWDPAICTDCGLCALVCPHAAIRHEGISGSRSRRRARTAIKSKPWRDKELPDHLLTVQVAPDDCTGCGVCVDVCPAKSKEVVRHKAINMEPKDDHLERGAGEFRFLPRHSASSIARSRRSTP